MSKILKTPINYKFPPRQACKQDAGTASKDGILHLNLGILSKMPILQMLACSRINHSVQYSHPCSTQLTLVITLMQMILKLLLKAGRGHLKWNGMLMEQKNHPCGDPPVNLYLKVFNSKTLEIAGSLLLHLLSLKFLLDLRESFGMINTMRRAHSDSISGSRTNGKVSISMIDFLPKKIT